MAIAQRYDTGLLNIPLGWPKPVRLSSERHVAEGLVRATIVLPHLSERFKEISGLGDEPL
jgi:hypothetical protein